MMNIGKKFEQQFKKSIPQEIFYYRFKDSGTSFGKFGSNEMVRFTSKNICDCELFDGERLYLFELKSHKGKSIPIGCLKRNEKDKRLEDLLLTTMHKNIVAGLIVEFSDVDSYFYIEISHITDFIRKGERKSIPYEYFAENGIEIAFKKNRINNILDIKKMLGEI